MRAGLLSDPRVVELLRTQFVPVHVSALNTAHCMHDPRDEALLKAMAGPATDRFQGGEREAFVLPDGTMSTVFLSLSGHDSDERATRSSHYTAAGRRDEATTRMFRHHGSNALRALHGALPVAWQATWDGDTPALRALAAESPRWPEPRAGEQGFRVFVRNSHLRYDDLHGARVVPIDGATLAAWTGNLQRVNDRSRLPQAVFDTLAHALLPRGTVDPVLQSRSIGGKLELAVDAVDGTRLRGTVTGSFSLLPTMHDEGGRRPAAAILFAVTGRFVGHFTFDRGAGTFVELKVAAADVAFAWKPRMASPDDFPPHYRAAVEWVRSEPAR